MIIVAWVISLINMLFGSLYIMYAALTVVGGMMGSRIYLSYDMLWYPIIGLCITISALVITMKYIKRLKWLLIASNSIFTFAYAAIALCIFLFV